MPPCSGQSNRTNEPAKRFVASSMNSCEDEMGSLLMMKQMRIKNLGKKVFIRIDSNKSFVKCIANYYKLDPFNFNLLWELVAYNRPSMKKCFA